MLEQLGIKALRPAYSGDEKAPNHANYDESKANPFPELPDALTLKSGKQVTTVTEWWHQRRPEIVEDFEREVLGRIPPDVPKVTWTVTSTVKSKAGVFPVIEKQLVGHVDNSSCPSISVDIQMTLVTPGNANDRVPVMVMFGSAAFLQRVAGMMAKRPDLKAMIGTDPPATEQLIAQGWGYAFIDPGSVQPDNDHAAVWQLPADQPVFRTDPNSLLAHSQLLTKAKQGGTDVYFEGDSITRRWGATDYPELLANWKQNFFGWNAADFGWGADQTQNILWRLENGELDGVNPKVVVLLAGTNNVGNAPVPGNAGAKADDVTRGLQAIVRLIQVKAPAATIVVTGILPRNDNMNFMPVIDRINGNLSRIADGQKVRYLNINDKLAGRDGRLFDGMMNASDKLHPTVKAYQIWADALKPVLTELLGPPAAVDYAPPPTGDPSASR